MNNTITMTKKEFRKVMEVIKYASKEEYRPILKCVHFENDEVVALDGYRVAVRKLNTVLDVSCNIDAKNLKEVIKLVTKEVKNIKMEFDNHTVIIELLGENDKLIDIKYYAYVEDNYINYKSIIDVDTFKFNTVASIEFNILHPIKDLISYLKKINKQNKCIKLDINNSLVIQQDTTNKKQSPLNGTVESWSDKEYFNYECKGELTIGVNHIYLRTMLENYKSDKESKLLFTGSSSPIVMSNNCGFDIVFPIRLTY